MTFGLCRAGVLSALCAVLFVTIALLGTVSPASADGWWAQLVRDSDLWSGPDATAESFGKLPRGQYVQVLAEQPFPGTARLYVQEATDHAYGYVEAIALAPSAAPPAPSDGLSTTTAPSGTPGDTGSTSSVPPVVGAPLFQPFWVANASATTLWSSPNAGDEALTDLPAFTKLLVLAPATGTRYYVQEARTEQMGYVDSEVVGPADPPTPEELAPPPAIVPVAEPSFKPWWVAVKKATDLWSGQEDGKSLGRVKVGDYLLVMEPQDGDRLHILNPVTKNYAFVAATAVAPSDAPKAAAIPVKGWKGQISGDVINLRPEPNTFITPSGQVKAGDAVTVSAWVEGEEIDPDNRTWAKVSSIQRRNAQGDLVELLTSDLPGDEFIYSGLLRPDPVKEPPPPPDTTLGKGGARWVDANLSQQTVTAYEGTKPVYFAPVTSGRPGWETPTGTFHILRRVENETMEGSTLLRLDTFEIPTYHLENVKWTQYFTGGGAALHTNYWRPASIFSMPSSHGCLGMKEQDARWFWDWAKVGTPVLVHY